MSLGSSRELAANKLIILFMVQKLQIRLSNMQLTKIVMENGFMNYFLLQQFLNELCESNMLSTEPSEDGREYYKITQSGLDTLNYFEKLIPLRIKIKIDDMAGETRKKIRNETSIYADFVPENESKYIVSLKICEDDFVLIDLKLTVGSRNDARSLCDKWKSNPQAMYTQILQILMDKKE